MATTILPVWEGEPTLDAEKIATILEWLAESQGDSDKTDDAMSDQYYLGQIDAYTDILNLLYGLDETPEVR